MLTGKRGVERRQDNLDRVCMLEGSEQNDNDWNQL